MKKLNKIKTEHSCKNILQDEKIVQKKTQKINCESLNKLITKYKSTEKDS